MPSEIDFVKGLRHIKRSVRPGLVQTNDCVNVLEFLCNDMSEKLIRETLNEYKYAKRKPDAVTPEYAQNAVKKFLTKAKLKDFAVARGQKAVYQFSENILRYDGRKVEQALVSTNVKPPATTSRVRSEASVFFGGINSLMENINRDRLLNLKAKHAFGNLMQNICKMMGQQAAYISQGKTELSHDDMVHAVDQTLAPTMASFAHAEGTALVSRYRDKLVVAKFARKGSQRDVADARRAISNTAPSTPDGGTKSESVYRSSLRKIAVDIKCPPLDNKSLKALDRILSDVMNILATISKASAILRDPKQLLAMDVEAAVSQVLPQGLVEQGLAEGRKATLVHGWGMFSLKFTKPRAEPSTATKKVTSVVRSVAPKVPSARQKKAPKKVVSARYQKDTKTINKGTLPDFTRGILQMVTQYPDMPSLDRPANENLVNILQCLSKKLATEAKKKCTSKILGKGQMNSAVASLFPGEIRDRAIEEGDSAILVPESV